MTAPAIEDLLRELTPQFLGALVRRHGQFEGCEDAVQEAVLAATVQWPAAGVPDNLCCHPTLTAASQTALTLRAVGGLTTAEIARAFLVPEATMAAKAHASSGSHTPSGSAGDHTSR
jgi:predicted RNA polymerase sigma factor